MQLSTGVGMSDRADAYDAGVQAAERALEQLPDKKAQLLIVFGAPRFDQAKLLEGITSVARHIPMIGGTTAGEISRNGLSVNSVVVLALASSEVTFYHGIGTHISKGEKQAGEQLAKDVVKNADRSKAHSLIMLPDGLAGDGLEIIEGVKGVLGEEFEIVGGALGDEAEFKRTFQYYDGQVYEDAVVGALICGTAMKSSTGVHSGWQSVGKRMTCTKAKGGVVFELDKKRALDVYRSYLGPERAQKLPAIGLEYPIGLIDERARVGGQEYFQLRSPLAIDEKAGSVTFAASVPEGSQLTLTYSSRNTIVDGARLAAEQAKKALQGTPRLILMFSCVARKMVLGRRTNEEVEAVQQVLGKDIPIFGFYTYGEIGPIDKMTPSLKSTRWHNETVVLYVLGE